MTSTIDAAPTAGDRPRPEVQGAAVPPETQGAAPLDMPAVAGRSVRGTPEFRTDLEGLRAVAVGLVLLFHAGVSVIPGGFVGVDVFYTLSGFLITGLLLREVQARGRIRMGRFYARRARRLLPAAALVLVATAVASLMVLPPLLWTSTGWDIIAASWDVVNFRFAAQSVDYMQAGQAPSPVLHFWSLALEEQFYLLWPALVMVGAGTALARHRNLSRVTLGILLAIVSAASLALCVWQTSVDAPSAFYLLPSRVWELGAGGLAAVAIPALGRVPGRLRAVVGWSGLGTIVAAGALLSPADPYPGWRALVPVLGTFAVIASCEAAGGPRLLLSTRGARALGRWSYSSYLWHWPILVLAAAALGVQVLPVWLALALTASAVALAAVTYSVLEEPVRACRPLVRSPRASLLMALVLALAGTTAGTVLISRHVGGSGGEVSSVAADQISAQVAAGTRARPVPADLTPALDQVRTALPPIYRDGCHAEFESTAFPSCVYGDPSGSVDAWLVGDSHAAMWFPAIDAIAKEHGWRLTVHTRSGCPLVVDSLASPTTPGAVYAKCSSFNDEVTAEIIAERPDLVIASSTVALIGPRMSSFQERLARIVPAAGKVVVLGDIPRQGQDVPPCVSANMPNAAACQTPRRIAEQGGPLEAMRSASEAAGAAFIPTLPWLCTSQDCPVIVSNVLLYRDATHLTGDGSVWLRPVLEPALLEQLPAATRPSTGS